MGILDDDVEDDVEQDIETSEFGKGTVYCLGLFLAHAGSFLFCKQDINSSTWFNGASDHLYDLVIPEDFPSELKQRLKILQDKSLAWGHGYPHVSSTLEDVQWAVDEAKDILLEIDKLNGIKAIKARFD